MNKIFKSRTINTAVVIAILGVLEANFNLLQPLLGEHFSLTWVVFSMIMVALRAVTTQPLSEKAD